MKEAAIHLRLLALALGALVLLSQPSCGDEFAPPSLIDSLRVIAVAADKPYAAPGDDVTFSLTYHDGFPGGPREVEVTWIGGCVNPPGGSYVGCYDQLGEAIAGLSEGDPPPASVPIARQRAEPSLSGTPGALTFTVPIPDDVLATAPPAVSGSKFASVFVLFTVCAGTVRPVPPEEGQGFVSLPFACFDDAGNRLGAEHFVPGFSQIYVFADGRQNENPVIQGLSLNGAELTTAAQDTVVVRCTEVAEEEGCGQEETSCVTYELRGLVEDTAELDPESTDEEGNPLREVVWIDYYTDAGSFEDDRALASDAARGFLSEQKTVWTPPAEPGPVRLWAVAHDNRGGMAVTSAMVMVE